LLCDSIAPAYGLIKRFSKYGLRFELQNNKTLVKREEFHCPEHKFVNLLRSPGIDSQTGGPVQQPNNSVPTQFLASIDCSKIPALVELCGENGDPLSAAKFIVPDWGI
jgi:hypothetical protein